MSREFYVVIERDEDGYFVGEVPQLRGCYSQGKTIDELMVNMQEVIELCLEDDDGEPLAEFVDIGRGLLHKILRDADMTSDELADLLGKS